MPLKVLRPLLFNIFMNEIFLFLECSNVCNHADDNTFLAFGKTFGEVASKLKNDFLILN